MFASLAIKIVEKLFDHAMQQRDEEKIRLHEHNRMLTNRARLTNTDELVLSFIERSAPMDFQKVAEKFPNVDCLPKRIAVFVAFGFVELNNNIISLAPKYKPIAEEIGQNSTDITIFEVPANDDTQSRLGG